MEIQIILLNFVYAMVGVLLGIGSMVASYKVFDRITPFDTGKELDDQNIAVGIVLAGMFVGIGLVIGLIVGMGLN